MAVWLCPLASPTRSAAPCALRQPPQLTCTSVSDTGKNISVPCGTWSTWYRVEVWNNAAAYCESLGSGAANASASQVQSFAASKP